MYSSIKLYTFFVCKNYNYIITSILSVLVGNYSCGRFGALSALFSSSILNLHLMNGKDRIMITRPQSIFRLSSLVKKRCAKDIVIGRITAEGKRCVAFAIDTFFQEIFGAFVSNIFIFLCFVHDDTVMVSFEARSNFSYHHTETRRLRAL